MYIFGIYVARIECAFRFVSLRRTLGARLPGYRDSNTRATCKKKTPYKKTNSHKKHTRTHNSIEMGTHTNPPVPRELAPHANMCAVCCCAFCDRFASPWKMGRANPACLCGCVYNTCVVFRRLLCCVAVACSTGRNKKRARARWWRGSASMLSGRRWFFAVG